MKKTYIEPANTVVKLNSVSMIAQSTPTSQTPADPEGNGTNDVSGSVLSRETISSQDAWDEW